MSAKKLTYKFNWLAQLYYWGRNSLGLSVCVHMLLAAAGSAHGQEVSEQVMFCRTDGRIVADSSAMRPTAEWRDGVVADFLKNAGCPYDVAEIDYCDSYRSMSIDDSTRISVDCVTFHCGDEAMAKWLNEIPDSTYVEIDIPAEAPEKCIAFRKSSTLVIVWCHLFADSDTVFRIVDGALDMKRRYSVFQYDNGDDYIQDGLRRIVDDRGFIGYADENGIVIIEPRFAFGFPFKNGKAKVTDKGEMKEVPGSGGEYHYWDSDEWYYIDTKGNKI